MNVEKAKFRALVFEDIGGSFEDDLESTQIRIYKLQGAHDALLQASKSVSEMSQKVRDALMDDKDQSEFPDKLAVAKYTVAKIQEVVAHLREMAEVVKQSSIKTDGQHAALQQVVAKMKKLYDVELSKVKSYEEAMKSGDVVEEGEDQTFVGKGPRPIGVHPGLPIKMKRRLQEEKDKDEAKAPLNPGDTSKVVRKRRKAKVSEEQS